MAMQIHGYAIEGDPEGLRYIERLRDDEAQVLFDEAKDHSRAKFQYLGKHYELVHASAGGYVVTHIHPATGIF